VLWVDELNPKVIPLVGFIRERVSFSCGVSGRAGHRALRRKFLPCGGRRGAARRWGRL